MVVVVVLVLMLWLLLILYLFVVNNSSSNPPLGRRTLLSFSGWMIVEAEIVLWLSWSVWLKPDFLYLCLAYSRTINQLGLFV